MGLWLRLWLWLWLWLRWLHRGDPHRLRRASGHLARRRIGVLGRRRRIGIFRRRWIGVFGRRRRIGVLRRRRVGGQRLSVGLRAGRRGAARENGPRALGDVIGRDGNDTLVGTGGGVGKRAVGRGGESVGGRRRRHRGVVGIGVRVGVVLGAGAKKRLGRFKRQLER